MKLRTWRRGYSCGTEIPCYPRIRCSPRIVQYQVLMKYPKQDLIKHDENKNKHDKFF